MFRLDMPAPLKVDWGLAQALFQEGVSLKNVAGRTGISYEALAKRSKRYNWRPFILAPSTKPSSYREPRSTVKPDSRAAQWQGKVLDIMDTHLSAVMDKSTPDVSLDELEQLVRITDHADRTARRTFGLDTESKTTNVLVQLGGAGRHEPRGEIVDVESDVAHVLHDKPEST